VSIFSSPLYLFFIIILGKPFDTWRELAETRGVKNIAFHIIQYISTNSHTRLDKKRRSTTWCQFELAFSSQKMRKLIEWDSSLCVNNFSRLWVVRPPCSWYLSNIVNCLADLFYILWFIDRYLFLQMCSFFSFIFRFKNLPSFLVNLHESWVKNILLLKLIITNCTR